ncbi:MAG: response regulator [Desulfurivibrionaceae bacterium]
MEKEKIRVLLVEDNMAEARLLQEALREVRSEDLRIRHVVNMSEFLAQVKADGFDAILLDLSLPDSQGLETLAKAQAAAPHLAIIVLTGNDDAAVALAAVRMGAQDYLFKGDTHGPLLTRAIDYAIERKRSQEEREQLIAELQDALAEVKQLSGLLPICSSCKSIRDDHGYWQQLEKYLDEHTELKCTHGLCPQCARKLYPELYTDEQQTDEGK